MRVHGRQESSTLLNNAHTGVAMPMDSALVALGQAEEAFQIQVVPRQVRVISADKQPRREGGHGLGHAALHRISAAAKSFSQGVESSAPCRAVSRGRIERGRYPAHSFDAPLHLRLLRFDLVQAASDGRTKPLQLLFCFAPFLAARLRCSESSISRRAAANTAGSCYRAASMFWYSPR